MNSSVVLIKYIAIFKKTLEKSELPRKHLENIRTCKKQQVGLFYLLHLHLFEFTDKRSPYIQYTYKAYKIIIFTILNNITHSLQKTI